MKTLREHKEEQAAQQQQAENEATFTAWIQKQAHIRNCIATRNAFEEFMEGEEVWTEADLDYALSQIPEGRLVTQRVKAEAELVAEENARRKSLSREELGKLAREAHPAPTAPMLPTTWTPRGRTAPVDISTREALMALVKADYPAFRELQKHFGSELINQRLGVQPAQKAGVSVPLPI
jgi:hypothetical protein